MRRTPEQVIEEIEMLMDAQEEVEAAMFEELRTLGNTSEDELWALLHLEYCLHVELLQLENEPCP